MSTKTTAADAVQMFVPLAGFRRATADEVKTWGEANGHKVNRGRGRMSYELVTAYNKANKRRKVQYLPGQPAAEATEYEYTTATGRKGKFTAPPADVRSWAEENGYAVKSKGRFTAEVRDAFGQAHAPTRKRTTRKPKVQADASE